MAHGPTVSICRLSIWQTEAPPNDMVRYALEQVAALLTNRRPYLIMLAYYGYNSA